MYTLLMSKTVEMPEWTFLSNHGHVLVQISMNSESRVRDIAEAVGITERSALSILADLEKGDFISVERVGRRNTYRVNPHKNFRHPNEARKPIGALMKIFS
ncbi:MAG: ArsR family transcriptional regulator [Actinobacteria bacterium]|jgi:DNA-binding MarR family transcriptional regulator|nr:ArsR family transcriptional regulator [Actinomycetota bacterium]NDA95707.1 ArsR family transcriptional regulator [Actinomycetota bacterium]NDH99670.1 ArsR family transcriptional regulator [Actinomycetota bacterium]NDI07606.1 ArsR family transcriptional regulator [Actinomycetota bacterium]